VNQQTAEGAMFGRPCSLIPPGSDDFSVVGTADTVERARKWAYDWEYLLFNGSADSCVHGLYRMDMCAFPACSTAGFDHTQIWIEGNGRGAFILTHPYVEESPRSLQTYAYMHGLQISSDPRDDWYGHSTLPIRLTIPNNWPLWPIERDAALLLHTQPIDWPADPDLQE
jgi:hypothetical protein